MRIWPYLSLVFVALSLAACDPWPRATSPSWGQDPPAESQTSEATRQEPLPEHGPEPAESAEPAEVSKPDPPTAETSPRDLSPTEDPGSAPDRSGALRLRAERLTDGLMEDAIVPGKWHLINFWATWCPPCRTELEGFLASYGRGFTAAGGRFVTVALEDEEALPEARRFLADLEILDAGALRLSFDVTPEEVDPRLGFDGDQVPYTVLVSPTGEVEWTHLGEMRPEELKRVVDEVAGLEVAQ